MDKVAALLRAVEARGGVARRKDLVASGFSAWTMQSAVSLEKMRSVARGYYALAGASETDVFLATHQARRTCLSKAADLGLWVLKEPQQLHVAAAHGRPVPGCVVHRVKGGQTLMHILRQCVRCGSEVEALVVLESAVVLHKCTIGQLREAAASHKDEGMRRIVGLIDPQAMSLVETCGRYHLKSAGYNVQGQAYIRKAGHLDLLVDGVLGIETDGEKYHNTPEAWAEDLRRDTMYVLEGIWRLRIPASVVLYHPEVMLRWVEQALVVIARGGQ